MALFLVTGAAGFIGAHLARRLVTKGHQVVTIDNLSTGYEENIPEGVMFIRGDCHGPDIYKEIPQEKYEAIFHMAGQSSGEVSFDDPTYDLRANTESTLRLLDFSVSTGCTRFIYGSTMSVYGEKSDSPISEEDLAVPLSFYAIGKLSSEHYLRLYEQYGVRSTALRFFNVYGPGQNLENLRQGMVSIYLAQALKNRHIEIRGSDTRYRDFVYIDDVIDACLACLSHPSSRGLVVNIGSGVRTTVRELLEKIIAQCPYSVTYEIKQGSTPGDTHGNYADIKKASEVLEYSPRYSLEGGLEEMMKWALQTHFFLDD